VSNLREQTRMFRISYLKEAIVIAKKKGRTVYYENLVTYCKEEWGVTRRTARDYIDSLKTFCKQEKIILAQ